MGYHLINVWMGIWDMVWTWGTDTETGMHSQPISVWISTDLESRVKTRRLLNICGCQKRLDTTVEACSVCAHTWILAASHQYPTDYPIWTPVPCLNAQDIRTCIHKPDQALGSPLLKMPGSTLLGGTHELTCQLQYARVYVHA
eukprot:1314972-Pleurochrysis_carterae.AAC.3